MALGPEWTRLQEAWIARRLVGLHVESAEGTDEGILLSLGGRGRREILFFSWNPRFCGLCRLEAPERRDWLQRSGKTPVLHEALRSHLGGAILQGVRQWQRDRVLRLDFRRVVAAGFLRDCALILEGTERQSNVSLLDEEGRILEVARRVYPEVNRYRTLLPGTPYVPPPPLPCRGPEGLSRAVTRYLDAASPDRDGVLEGLAQRLYAPEGDPLSASWRFLLRGEDLLLLPEEVAPPEAQVLRDPLEASRLRVFFPLRERLFEGKRGLVRRALQGRLQSLRSQWPQEGEDGGEPEKARRYRTWGELLFAQGYSVPPGTTVARLTDWERPEGPPLEVPLLPGRTPVETAQEYFIKYRRCLDRHRAALLRQEYLRGEMATLEEQEALLEAADTLEALEQLARELGVVREPSRRNPRSPALRQARVAGGAGTLFLGESARGNRQLTFRLARPGDWWFHAKDLPGAHVLFRREDGVEAPPEERWIREIAALAAWYSRGRGSGRVWVDYTQRKHVRSLPEKGIAGVRYSSFKSVLAEPKPWDGVLRGLREDPEEGEI